MITSAQAEMGELRSQHFVVRFDTARDFAQKVLNAAEAEYDRIGKNLGYARYDRYWTFEGRCTIHVYDTREDYLNSRKSIPPWSSGYAEYETRTLSGFRGSDKFLTTILPHEITHLIFSDYVGTASQIPKWFSEGVALAQEVEGQKIFKDEIGKALHGHYFIPIYLLSDGAFQGVHNYQFTYLAYAEAALLVKFLISYGGSERFVQLCRKFRDGIEFKTAFEDAYRGTLDGLEGFERKFIEDFLGKE